MRVKRVVLESEDKTRMRQCGMAAGSIAERGMRKFLGIDKSYRLDVKHSLRSVGCHTPSPNLPSQDVLKTGAPDRTYMPR